MSRPASFVSSSISTPLVVANWKMNHLRDSASGVITSLTEMVGSNNVLCDIVICPPATLLIEISKSLTKSSVLLGAQDCHTESSGAYTGDISAEMLVDAGCEYVIVGHSERRIGCGETDTQIKAKAEAAHSVGLIPIICVGETAEERQKGHTLDTVKRQLADSLPSDYNKNNTVVAYEPVWAIGSGKTPTVTEIVDVHRYIRGCLETNQHDDLGSVRVLYGGSVNPETAPSLADIESVNGALVGGASLSAEPFWRIVEIFASSKH